MAFTYADKGVTTNSMRKTRNAIRSAAMDATCPECTNEIDDGDTVCPRCGAALVAPQVLPLMSVVNEPQPVASPSLALATRVAAVLFAGWLCVLAVFGWITYNDGYTEIWLPAWNTVVLVGMLPIVAGVFARRMWAHRWMIGTAMFTGLMHVMQVNENSSALLWIGILVLGAVAAVLAVARPIFRHDNAHRGTLAQLIAITVTLGSILVYYKTSNETGSERGRAQFAAETQQNYANQGLPDLRVHIEKRTLVIDAPGTDDQIDATANTMSSELQRLGVNAKVWALGFSSIKLTNGIHSRWLRAAEFQR